MISCMYCLRKVILENRYSGSYCKFHLARVVFVEFPFLFSVELNAPAFSRVPICQAFLQIFFVFFSKFCKFGTNTTSVATVIRETNILVIFNVFMKYSALISSQNMMFNDGIYNNGGRTYFDFW